MLVDIVKLVGLDFGTTTSSAVVASARLLANSVTGRKELTQISETYRSDILFTPYAGNRLDETKLAEYLDSWLDAGSVQPGEVFGGGALLTGLAAQKENADTLRQLVRSRIGGAFIASADDPCLESWLAFMGNNAALSRTKPNTWFLNLDIGGGTTNLALGINGEVVTTGCLFVGARHVELLPGTYRIKKLSSYARALFDHLGIPKVSGDELSKENVKDLLAFYLRLLEAAILGQREVFEEPVTRLHEQVPFHPDITSYNPETIALTLSGGVGELVYVTLEGKPLPPTTYFGDLGIDLAERLLGSPFWSGHLGKHVPAGGGRATVYGLMRHSTQISGNTVYLADPAILPLQEIPIFGTITDTTDEGRVRSLIGLANQSPRGGCVRIRLGDRSPGGVRNLGTRISTVIVKERFPDHHPLVILVEENLGKALGQYISQWGRLALSLVVIDEIAVRDAQYVNIGSIRDQALPVSFFGLES
jgi:ethanolamine utilization protein EutA